MHVLGVEANIYPITTMAYIEDKRERLSLIVDHASAATSQKQGLLKLIIYDCVILYFFFLTCVIYRRTWKKSHLFSGWLEVIVDRRATFDDARGMGEGILDSIDTVHKYWLLYESIEQPKKEILKQSKPSKPKEDDHNQPLPKPLSTPSDLANFLSRRINYPTIQYMGKNTLHDDSNVNGANKDTVLHTQFKILRSKVLTE